MIQPSPESDLLDQGVDLERALLKAGLELSRGDWAGDDLFLGPKLHSGKGQEDSKPYQDGRDFRQGRKHGLGLATPDRDRRRPAAVEVRRQRQLARRLASIERLFQEQGEVCDFFFQREGQIGGRTAL